MQIDDAEERLVLLLQRDPVHERTEIVADVQVPGRLDAGHGTDHGDGIQHDACSPVAFAHHARGATQQLRACAVVRAFPACGSAYAHSILPGTSWRVVAAPS